MTVCSKLIKQPEQNLWRKNIMENEKLKEILSFMKDVSKFYLDDYLDKKLDWEKFENDKKYAKIKFFDFWGLERSGIPKNQRLATIKFLNKNYNELKNINLKEKYREFHHDKINEKMNPMLDESIRDFDISKILSEKENLKGENLKDAYNKIIELRGIKHKIASFFLRDVSYRYSKENPDLQDSVYLFPVDIWVRDFIGALDLPVINEDIKKPKGMNNKKDFELSLAFCKICLDSGFDPREMNMGIWYFCANVAGEVKRLETLINQGAEAMRSELDLIRYEK